VRELVQFLKLGPVAGEVLVALAPLVFFFVLFQATFLKLPRHYVLNMAKGAFLTFLGLVLFLQGVKVDFMPAGVHIGRSLGEPEKEIVLTAVPRSRTERVLAAIVKGELDKPGAGIAFVLELKAIEGICHLLMKE